jgi:hypothetical protein
MRSSPFCTGVQGKTKKVGLLLVLADQPRIRHGLEEA